MLIKNQIGCHLSIKGSILNIFKEAKILNIKTIACFTGSNLQYNFNTTFNTNIITEFKKKIDEESYTVFSHACYLINIADIKKTENYQKSVQALTAELTRCNILGIKGIAFHPGSNPHRKEGLMNIANTLNTIFETYTENTKLYIESSAGEGNKIPTFLEEIEIILKNLSIQAQNKVAIALDTCHIFAAGYDLTSKNAVDKFLLYFDSIIGIDKIELIHLNDSKKKCNSNIDRHETLGMGEIGINNIIHFLNHTQIKTIPKILETPVTDYLEWKKELSLLDNLLKDDIMIHMS